MQSHLIGVERPEVVNTKCKVIVTIIELNHSNILIPGQPEMPPIDPRIKFLATVMVPGPLGPQGPMGPASLAITGDSRENVLKGVRELMPKVMRDMRYASFEQFELEL